VGNCNDFGWLVLIVFIVGVSAPLCIVAWKWKP